MAKFISIPVTHYKKYEDLKKQNDYLTRCAERGKIFGIREEKVKGGGKHLYFANYDDNRMYIMSLDKKGNISKITKW